MSPKNLNREQLIDLLDKLSSRLERAGQHADLFVVGGAAMSLLYEESRLTRDMDGVFFPPHVVRKAVSDIAAETGLADDWLNDGVKGFLPGADADARTIYNSSALRVEVASPEYLLAMKLHSGRFSRDIPDAVKLATITNLTTPDQMADLLEKMYPRQLHPRHTYIVETVAEQAMNMREVKEAAAPLVHRKDPAMDDYRIAHRAPGPEEDGTTVRLDKIGGNGDEVFPADVNQHPNRYGALHAKTMEQVRLARGNPDMDVTVWRAVPQGVTQINPGDWVALSEEYAKSEAAIENGHVISATAKAKDLWNEGLLEEWGYAGASPLDSRPTEQGRSVQNTLRPETIEALNRAKEAVEAATRRTPQPEPQTRSQPAHQVQKTPETRHL